MDGGMGGWAYDTILDRLPAQMGRLDLYLATAFGRLMIRNQM